MEKNERGLAENFVFSILRVRSVWNNTIGAVLKTRFFKSDPNCKNKKVRDWCASGLEKRGCGKQSMSAGYRVKITAL